jgi:WD40 repeat protein
MAFRPDSQAVIAGCLDGSARIWDIATGSPIGAALGHQGGVTAVAFSSDGKLALTGSSDGTAKIWDVTTGKPLGRPLPHAGPVYAVAFSPDGKTVVTGSGDPVARLWDPATGVLIREIPTLGAHVHTVAFGADGKIVATAGEAAPQIWDAATGAVIGNQIASQGFVQAMEISRDGKTLRTAAESGLETWDTATGRPTGAPLKHLKSVATACFSPDGHRILVATGDAFARLWDAASARQLGPALPHQGRVPFMAISPDGRTAATSSGNNEVLLWDVAELPDDLARVECWVHLTTGLTIDAEGQIRNLTWPAWREQRELLSSLGGAPEEAKPRWRLDPILYGAEPTARAQDWVKRGRWAQAEAAFNEAVNARPFDAAVRLERARFFASRSQPGRADDDFAQSYVLGSRDPKLIQSIIASEPLFERVVAQADGSDADLWARRGDLRLSQSRWDDAAADFARELEHSPIQRSWGSSRSTRLLSLASWDRAYTRLMELRPTDGQLWCVRGRYYALRGQWEQAAADFARGVASAPPNSEEWFEHACLRLILGDEEGYREFVQEIGRREGQTSDPFIAYVLARTCGLSARPPVEPEQAIRWAESTLRYSRPTWYLHALGAAHYRASHFDEAIKLLEESKAAFARARSGDNYNLQNNLVLAMAHARSGHTAQARGLLEEAKRSWELIEAARIDGATSMPTVDWLPAQILHREALAVIVYDPAFPVNPFAH